jgi:SAM-dependent methyltransferase
VGQHATIADTLVRPTQTEFTPALRSLMETVVPTGSHCLNVGHGTSHPLGPWLGQHDCSHVGADVSQVSALPFGPESFDAALLICVLDRLAEPYQAARELRRVLRPGGVLLVTTPNCCYWRRRLERVLPGEDRQGGAFSPASLRRMLLEAGFSLVGVEGQDGAVVRDLPLAGRFSKGRASAPYRLAERLFPSLLGSRVGAFAIRV